MQRTRTSRFLFVALPLSLLLAGGLVGCQPEVKRGATAKPQETAKPASESRTVLQGGGSALGQAKGAAERTADKSDAYQQKLNQQIEELNK